MSQTNKIILTAIIAALIGSGGTYLWQSTPVSQTANTDFNGAAKYNCKLSGGSFKNNACECPLEGEQTQEEMYDKSTGFCQSTIGGPAADAFAASIGLPYGDYGFFMNIVINSCVKSGGEMSGSACICPNDKIYDKETGYCS